MDVDFSGYVTSLDAELLPLPEVSPLAIKSNPYVAEKLFDQWLSLPDTTALGAAGGAQARSFIMFRNSLGSDLSLRIATELHLKRMLGKDSLRLWEVHTAWP